MTQEQAPIPPNLALQDAKGVLAALFGPVAVEIGIALQGYLIPWTLSNVRRVAGKVDRIRVEQGIDVTKSLPPRYAFMLLEGASKEDDENLAEMWAALISKATDPASGYDPLKRHIELLKVLDPLQAKILVVLHDRVNDGPPPLTYFNAEMVSVHVDVSLEHTLIALRALFSLGLVSDYWLQTFDGMGTEAFAKSNAQSHILISAFGRDLISACRYSKK